MTATATPHRSCSLAALLAAPTLSACGGGGGSEIASTPPPIVAASVPVPVSATPTAPAPAQSSSRDFAAVTAPITPTHGHTGAAVSQTRLATGVVRYGAAQGSVFNVGKDDNGGYSIGISTVELGTSFDGEQVSLGVSLPSNARWFDEENPGLIRYKARLTGDSPNQMGDYRLDLVDLARSPWGNVQCTELGFLNYCNSTGQTSCGAATRFAALAFGSQPQSVLPQSGSAAYREAFLATDWARDVRLDGDVALQLDFGTQSVSVTLGHVRVTGSGNDPASLGDFMLTGRFGPGYAFGGTVQVPTNPRFLDGTWQGAFFGPAGQEVGGVLQLPQISSAEALLGVFATARKTP